MEGLGGKHLVQDQHEWFTGDNTFKWQSLQKLSKAATVREFVVVEVVAFSPASYPTKVEPSAPNYRIYHRAKDRFSAEGSSLSTESPPIVHSAFTTILRHPSDHSREHALAILVSGVSIAKLVRGTEAVDPHRSGHNKSLELSAKARV